MSSTSNCQVVQIECNFTYKCYAVPYKHSSACCSSAVVSITFVTGLARSWLVFTLSPEPNLFSSSSSDS